MNKEKTKTLAMIAMILQAIAVAAGLGIVVMQKVLVPALMVEIPHAVGPVIPVTLFFMALQLVIFIVFFNASKNEEKKSLVIILVAVSVLLSILSVGANAIGTGLYYRLTGAEAVAIYSAVSTLISYANVLFGIPAASLFYLACGQYTGR